MSERPLITSLLDTDLYKLTMQAAVCRSGYDWEVQYELIQRRGNLEWNTEFLRSLRWQIDSMAGLSLTEPELRFLAGLPGFDKEYLSFLGEFRFRPEQVRIEQQGIRVEGPWREAILWEVPLLALLSELHFHDHTASQDLTEYRERARAKAVAYGQGGCKIAEFGTRRRRSLRHQEMVLEAFMETETVLLGTSNLMLARQHEVSPIGTMAHEWIMAHGARHGLARANSLAWRRWLELFGSAYRIALADTYTHDLFFHDFTIDLSNAFDGVRHDSGDPIRFACQLEQHYREHGIDPRSKRLVFSDGLDLETPLELQRRFGDIFQLSYGIGTFLTNDVPGDPPLDMVMKLTAVEGVPAVKLSDVPGKESGPPKVVRKVRREVEQILGRS